MNDLIEIVEDLKNIDTFGSDTTAFEDILEKWEERLAAAEDEAERQYEMFAGVTRILDKRYESFEMDLGE